MKRFCFLLFLFTPLVVHCEVDQLQLVEKPTTAIVYSSELNRNNKNLEVDALLYGFGGYNSYYTYGYQAAHLIDFNSQIIIQYFENYVDTKTNLKSSLLGIHFKKFYGNSFYLQSGIDQTVYYFTTNNSNDSWYAAKTGLNASFTSKNTSFTLAIGNQWHWENLTLGCSWLGASYPLISSISDESFNGNVSASNLSDFRSKIEGATKSLTFHAVRFYLGYSF